MYLQRPSEIEEGFHDAIQPKNFLRKDVDLVLQLFLGRSEARAEQIQTQHNRVERILDFVRHAAGYSVHRIQPRREPQVRFELLMAFGVADSDQRRGSLRFD